MDIVKSLIPVKIKHQIKQWMTPKKPDPFKNIEVIHQSQFDTIHHCCVQKTASQWFKKIFQDARIYQYSGLRQWQLPGFDLRPLNDRFYEEFPTQSIISPVYIGYDAFQRLSKPSNCRTFFVMRDPRDVVVSWYFSTLYSHTLMGRIGEMRDELNQLSQEDGLLYSIRQIDEKGIFEALESWTRAKDDTAVRLVRFESVTGANQAQELRDLLTFCDIRLPDDVFNSLIEEYSFSNLSGRKKGNEDPHAHLRKGTPGDWQNHFTPAVTDFFSETVGDLVTKLGYEDTL